MKKTRCARLLSLLSALVLALGLTACGTAPAPAPDPAGPPTGEILLYGEHHNSPSCKAQELSLWQDHYAQGMRHLFLELGEADVCLLNLWMAAEDDALLDVVYDNAAGTAGHTDYQLEFYKQVKATCPETVFHGFDLQHQYETSGAYCLTLLEEGTEAYLSVEEGIAAAEEFYSIQKTDLNAGWAYREAFMGSKFAADFDALGGLSVMAIAGDAHVNIEEYGAEVSYAILAQQLQEHCVDTATVTAVSLDINVPVRVDTLTIGGREYQAEYFGESDISSWSDVHQSRAYWRIVGGYDDFSAYEPGNDYLPANNYPMELQENDSYAILYHKKDGSQEWWYATSYADEEYDVMTRQVIIPG